MNPIIVGAQRPMNNPSIFSPTIKNKYDENIIENNTHPNKTISDIGIFLYLSLFFIMVV